MEEDHAQKLKRRRVSEYTDEAFGLHSSSSRTTATTTNPSFPVLPSIGSRALVKKKKKNPESLDDNNPDHVMSCVVMSGIQSGLYSGMVLVKYDDGSTGHVDPDDLQIAAVTKGSWNARHNNMNGGSSTTESQQPQAPQGSLMAQLQELRKRKEQITAHHQHQLHHQVSRKEPASPAPTSASSVAAAASQPNSIHATINNTGAISNNSIGSPSSSTTSPPSSATNHTPLATTTTTTVVGRRGTYVDFLTLSNADELSRLYNHDTVTCVSCGGTSTTIMIYQNGHCEWTHNNNNNSSSRNSVNDLPSKLAATLKQRQQLAKQSPQEYLFLPKPTYVAIGTQDRFFIQYDNGEADWNACEIMSKDLFEEKHTSRSVVSVAFGSEWDSFFEVYSNGGVCFDNVSR